VALLFNGRILINLLLFSYLIGQILSFLVFIFRGFVHINIKRVNYSIAKIILDKAFFLFIYNFIFYLILLSTRSIVSSHYTVADFGNFTFAYTLASAVITLIDAIASLVVPKLIDRYNTEDVDIIDGTINILRINYMYSAYAILEFLLLGFTVVLFFLKTYSSTLGIVILMSLTVVLQTHAFPYTTYLMAKGKEKYLALSSIIALFVNIALVYLLIYILNVDYQFIILGTWVSYFLYSVLNIYFVRLSIKDRHRLGIIKIIKECMPINLFLPVVILAVAAFLSLWWVIMISMAVYFAFNYKQVKVILDYVLVLIRKPEIINIKK
jgi:O-antigen/teichoic acid export membrane protein